MTTPTLTYVSKAEIARLIFAYTGVKYNDVRVERPMPDDLKAKAPYAMLPYYEDDDLQTGQSVAISRYLAVKYKLAGTTPKDCALADAYIDAVWDLIMPYYQGRSSDPEKLKIFEKENIPRFLTRWESDLVGRGGKYFVGQSLTWADLGIYWALVYLAKIGYPDALSQYPALSNFAESIGSIPSIKAHVDSRPVTQF
eukprot:gene8397-9878_t